MSDMTNIIQAINNGSVIMLVGMGIVFTFLTILVFAIDFMTKIVTFVDKICPPPVEEVKTKKKTTDESEIALAIAIAAAE